MRSKSSSSGGGDDESDDDEEEEEERERRSKRTDAWPYVVDCWSLTAVAAVRDDQVLDIARNVLGGWMGGRTRESSSGREATKRLLNRIEPNRIGGQHKGANRRPSRPTEWMDGWMSGWSSIK